MKSQLSVLCGNNLQARVLMLNKQFIAIEKPHNVLSQPDFSGDESICDSVRNFLIKHYEKPGNAYVGTVHRLDRPASGIMVLACTSKAAARLSAQFRQHTVYKEYLAVVARDGVRNKEDGLIKGDESLLDSANSSTLAFDEEEEEGGRGEKSFSKNSFQQGDLEWKRVRDVGNVFSVLRIRVQTGRKHQIRSQLCKGGIGPIVGDVKYGYRGPIPHHFPSEGSVMLYANRLEFDHPISKERVMLSSPPNAWPKAFWPAFYNAGSDDDGQDEETPPEEKTKGKKKTKIFT